jgi:ABC-type Fe3+-hydroxamate transport system substrate-binding protein
MEFIDQTGYKITMNGHSKRVVSIVPSQTELLYYIGLEPIAQTIFCVHPSSKLKNSIKIGGTKKLNIPKIKSLKPDLIIGNKEENDKEQILELRKHFPVWLSDIYTIEDSNSMIKSIGEMTNMRDESQELIEEINSGFQVVSKLKKAKSTVLYLIWRNPYMAAGQSTFINDILIRAGYTNALQNGNSRYPELSNEDIISLHANEILLSSEPFPFTDKHITELQTLLPNTKVKLIDGELFSWYGPRLLKTIEYLKD